MPAVPLNFILCNIEGSHTHSPVVFVSLGELSELRFELLAAATPADSIAAVPHQHPTTSSPQPAPHNQHPPAHSPPPEGRDHRISPGCAPRRIKLHKHDMLGLGGYGNLAKAFPKPCAGSQAFMWMQTMAARWKITASNGQGRVELEGGCSP